MAEPLGVPTEGPARIHSPRPGRTSPLRVNGIDLQLAHQNLAGAVTVPPEPLRLVAAPAPAPETNSAETERNPEPRRRDLGYRLSELVGMVPLLAPLAAAGWYQADLAHQVFGWTYPFALVWPAAIEGGAAYAATMYLRKLVSGHSTIGARSGMMAYAAGSSALLWWHAIDGGKPWQAAAGIGGMTLAAMWIWTQRSRWLRRKALQDRGLVDAQAPRFNLLRWLLCPVETPRAFRYAVKYGVQNPQEALDAYRRERQRRRIGKALERARRNAAKHRKRSVAPEPSLAAAETEPAVPAAPEPAVEPSAPAPVPDRPPATRSSKPLPAPRRKGSGNDDADLADLERAYGTRRTPSLKEIKDVLECGVPKAQRLQRAFRERLGGAS